jgi:hypothetical protein
MFDPAIWSQFGLPGLVIAALLLIILALYRYVIQPMMTLHREERKEWLDTCQAIFDRSDHRQAETNQCIREINATVQSLSDRAEKRADTTLRQVK